MTYCYISRKILFFLLIFTFFSFSPVKDEISGIIFENESIVITAKTEQCILPKNGTENFNVLLSIRNKTSNKITVSFLEERYYDGVCSSCGKEEYRYAIDVEPNGTKQSTCEQIDPYCLTVFHHMPNGMTKAQLTDLRLTQVSITTIQ